MLLLYIFVINKDDNIYVEEITLSKNEIKMYVNDSYQIDTIMQIAPTNYNVQIMCYAENSNYISIVDGYTIKAKKEGETKVIIKALNSEDTYINKVLDINIVPKETHPSSFEFESSKIVVELNKSATNKIICLESYTANPVVSYSVSNICTYNYTTGEILAKNIGSTIVKVKFQSDTLIVEREFEVVVTKVNPKIILTNATKENDIYVLNVSLNTHSRIYMDLLDAEGNSSSFATSLDLNENAVEMRVISPELKCIKFVCAKKGEQIIKIYKTDDESVFVNIKIIVGD